MTKNAPLGLLALIVAQTLCALFFFSDVFADALEKWPNFVTVHIVVEAIASVVLLIGVAFESRMLINLLRREAHLKEQLSLAAGAFHDIVTQRFHEWGLTPSEQDVALFTLKGLAIPEIAAVRGSAEGTIKAHLGAIYRKAGVNGRGAFLALFIEELMVGPAQPEQAAA
ncbi:helix-turn-helix transcriptional regulator [Sagittula sp. S175]|uniref:helix-turn-helix transcriptional regulator n=1 Tax=Sagittula sp. S175 TaxID=3415129 RepID=UPI003C7CF4D5